MQEVRDDNKERNPDNEEQMCDDEKTSQKGNLDDLILAAERMRRK